MEQVLELRDLAPPEPLERTLAAVARLAPGERLCVHVPREPLPLYALLERAGCRFASRALPDGGFEVRIEVRS